MPTQMNGTSKPDRELWMDHLAISIGSDLRGGSPSIVTGRRGAWSSSGRSDGLSGTTRLGKITRRSCPGRRVDPQIDEFRSYGHDCIQHAGQMMFIPSQADAHVCEYRGIPCPWSRRWVSGLAKERGPQTFCTILAGATMMLCCASLALHSVARCVSWWHLLHVSRRPGFAITRAFAL